MSFTPTPRSLGINWNEAAKRLANVQLEEWVSQNASLIAADPGWLDANFSAFTLEWKRLMMEAVLAEALSCHNLYLKRTPEVTDNRFFSPAILHTYIDTSPEQFGFYAGDVDMDLLVPEVADWLKSLLPQAKWHKIPEVLRGDTLNSDYAALIQPQDYSPGIISEAESSTAKTLDIAEGGDGKKDKQKRPEGADNEAKPSHLLMIAAMLSLLKEPGSIITQAQLISKIEKKYPEIDRLSQSTQEKILASANAAMAEAMKAASHDGK